VASISIRAARLITVLKAGLLSGLLGGCYSYHPALAAPEPTSKVSVVLTDVGRQEAARQVGPRTDRLEGAVVSSNDTEYVFAVSSVKPIGAEWVRWTGETVSVRRDHIALLYQRRLSKSRTALLVLGATAAVVTTMLKFNLLGLGNDPGDPGNPGDPGDQ
jgi:hypothetical protein